MSHITAPRFHVITWESFSPRSRYSSKKKIWIIFAPLLRVFLLSPLLRFSFDPFLLLFCTRRWRKEGMNSSSFPSITLSIWQILSKTFFVFQPSRQCCFKLLGYLQGLFILREFDETTKPETHGKLEKNCGKRICRV